MFDRLPSCGAKPGLSPATEEEGKIAFHGFRQIIEFKSPVYNSSWSRRLLSIYLKTHFPFSQVDKIAPRLLLGAVNIPHNAVGKFWAQFTQFSAIWCQNGTNELINKCEPRKETDFFFGVCSTFRVIERE